jgi:hypothetical protein
MLLKKALLITYHFPPSAASGSFRLLGFAKHLPMFGWRPLVVAPPQMPWEPVDVRLSAQVPEEVVVESSPYPAGAPKLFRALAKNAVWLPRAWSACKRVVHEHRPDVILTSGPPHCVHALGHYLKRSTGLPWVADFRDPWLSDGKEKVRGLRRWTLGWERRVFQNADLILANAPNARRLYQETYPLQRDKVVMLTNGFDPRTIESLAYAAGADSDSRSDDSVRLVHAGSIYAGRDPVPLFLSLQQLNAEAPTANRYQLQILGRCEMNGIDLPAVLRQQGWSEFVDLQGQRTYQDTLDAMERADILVLFDSPGRKIGVPAKLYEYIGSARPVLALAEADGDVASILRESGVLHRIASPRNTLEIQHALLELELAMRTTAAVADPLCLQQFTREYLTQTLANHFDRLTRRM